MNRINISVACDDNYAKYAGVVIASALYCADKEDELVFYILDGGITQENKEKISSLKSIKNCEINFVQINEEMFKCYKEVKTHGYITIATYYRLKLASLLPDIDKIIYLDCDTVVNSSLKELFEKDTSNYLIAGVSDTKKRMVKKNPHYVNAGMIVMDLKNIRKDNTEEKFFNYTKENINKITKGDQEIINDVCKDKILVIEPEWNVQTSNFTNRSCYTAHPKIIHYVSSSKPWRYGSYSYFKNYWFKYLQLTPWALKEDEKFKWYFKNQIVSMYNYWKRRPLFMLRPRFYKALLFTYIIKK